MLEHIPCNLCGSEEYILVYPATIPETPATVDEYVSTATLYAQHHDIVRCTQCGLLYMNPRDTDIAGLYADVVDQPYLDSWEERTATFMAHLRYLGRFKPGRRVLDVGCYAGIFAEAATQMGFEVTGVEPSRWAAQFTRTHVGCTVVTGGFENIDTESLGPEPFDMATLWDVIEHLTDPLGSLKRVAARLRPGGIVAVTTHDIGSITARIMGRRYPWLMRFHLYHFTPRTLETILRAAGLEPLKTRRYVKSFSLAYLATRMGLRLNHPLFKRIRIPYLADDMIMTVAQKPLR